MCLGERIPPYSSEYRPVQQRNCWCRSLCLELFLYSDSCYPAVDAVLNSVATAFILDIDSSYRPLKRLTRDSRSIGKGKMNSIIKALGWKGIRWFDWTLDSIPGKLMALVHDFIINSRGMRAVSQLQKRQDTRPNSRNRMSVSFA